MTVAFFLYIAAFVLARQHFSWKTHVVVAIAGFLADMYATTLMVRVFESEGIGFLRTHNLLRLHVALSLVALFAFLIQAWLGLRIMRTMSPHARIRKRAEHSRFAVVIFFPTWVSAYVSGFALVLR